jgi:DNA-binding Lrp family transcriptional regulator
LVKTAKFNHILPKWGHYADIYNFELNAHHAINLNTMINPRIGQGKVALINQVSEAQAKILKELLADGRKSQEEIVENTGLPKETVKKNYLKMEKMGIITGATTHINYKIFGYKVVAHVLVNVDSRQAEQLIEYLKKMPEVYSVSSAGTKGNISVVTILKTLEQLNEVKDCIKNNFSVFEMRTAIWTDVKEMNYNLSINAGNRKNPHIPVNYVTEQPTRKSNPKSVTIDEIDQKIADILAENGLIAMEELGQKTGISPETAKKRYEKLRNNGVLKVTIQVNPYKIGYLALCVFFTVTSDEKSFQVIKKVSSIPDIISIMKTTGDYDMQIWAMVQDLDQLLSIQEEIGKIQGIKKFDLEILRFGEWGKWPSPRQYISTF